MSALRLTKDEVLRIHEVAIARFGGLDGVRDEGMLESALAQPHMTFDGIELYPSVEERAARYAYGICKDHPFIDGNKRVAAACLATYLRLGGVNFRPPHGEFLRVMLALAAGTLCYEELVSWVREMTSHTERS